MNKTEKEIKEEYLLNKEDGIMSVYEAFYIEAIIYSSGRATDAFARFDKALVEAKDADTIVAIVHEAITHVGGLSRFFWPTCDKKNLRKNEIQNARGKKLRVAFELDDTSPLFDRNLRNRLEHFDEDLDEFLLQDKVGNFYPNSVVGSVSLIDSAIDSIFRLVDPEEDIFVLLGEKYSFGPLKKSVDDVFEKAQRMNGNGGRLS